AVLLHQAAQQVVAPPKPRGIPAHGTGLLRQAFELRARRRMVATRAFGQAQRPVQLALEPGIAVQRAAFLQRREQLQAFPVAPLLAAQLAELERGQVPGGLAGATRVRDRAWAGAFSRIQAAAEAVPVV